MSRPYALVAEKAANKQLISVRVEKRMVARGGPKEQLRSDLLGALTENPAPTVVTVCGAWRVFEPGLLPAESIKRRRDLLRRMSEKRQRKNEAPTREASSAWKEGQRVL